MTKRLVCLALAIIMLFSRASCAIKENDDPNEPLTGVNNPEGNKPEDTPTHKHTFVEGKCECGASDPDYKPEDKPNDGATKYAISYEQMDGTLMDGYAPTEAAEGERIVLRAHPLMDATLDLYANGEKLECTHADSDYWEYVFVMPARDVKITRVISDGFLPDVEYIPTVYLAGDSTVKTYEDGQYIGGWGQFLDLFLSDEIKVVNAAHGGRSSRSFINEGRLFNIEGNNYSFSQNGGNSIEDLIKAGDYLLIQFGHNDDASKLSNYSTIYDRMVPLGTPDENGIYPVTPAVKSPTTFLPEEYTKVATDSEEQNALTEIAKYGSEYYAYGSGTYKWYLKQYIDFAREHGAIPVLITPVARVKFNSNGEIIGGAGLHGENFAYVEAVRQLAKEEDCLLIDLFSESKEILETATPSYANYLMALKPNGLTGTWPADYDATYGNGELGYEGIEATHYNKYGAFLQAARVAEAMLAFGEDHPFYDKVLTAPETYIDPPNLISKTAVGKLEGLFTVISVTNPNRSYYDPKTVVDKINEIPTEITVDNYLEVMELCSIARACYSKVNIDDRAMVTNLAALDAAEKKCLEIADSLKPDPVKTVVYVLEDYTQEKYESTVTDGDLTFVATAEKSMQRKSCKTSFSYADVDYTTAYGLSVGGSAKFGQYRYLSFVVDGPCTITCAVLSSNNAEARTLNLYNSQGTVVDNFVAGTTVELTTVEVTEGGTYSLGSAGSGMYILAIIIEYYE